MTIVMIGIDLGKNSCSVAALDEQGAVVLRRRMRPASIASFAAAAITLWLARGLIRIAEQDPFRAIVSVWPGLKLALSANALIIGGSLIVLLGMNIRKILTKLGIPLSSTQPRVAKF